MNAKHKAKYWFTAKRYGWGWVPATKEGWLVLLLYIVFITDQFIRVDSNSHSVSDTLYDVFPAFILATTILLLICYKKGEKPSWNWGNKKRHE